MDNDSPGLVNVEVAAAWPDRQALVALRMPAGSTVADALEKAGFSYATDVGIFGRHAELDQPLVEGDRVEIYRSLLRSPKQARRRRLTHP
ncbi:MAG: RnfH family protein [Nevskiaceae bacterium]|nr:MAG: RnfH family protein [Nevskiaceae bacterium]TBR72044.1 MAG: RnfH family protein [Nevskiaceae bacterium]